MIKLYIMGISAVPYAPGGKFDLYLLNKLEYIFRVGV